MSVVFALDNSQKAELQSYVAVKDWQAAYQLVIDLTSSPETGQPATGMGPDSSKKYWPGKRG